MAALMPQAAVVPAHSLRCLWARRATPQRAPAARTPMAAARRFALRVAASSEGEPQPSADAALQAAPPAQPARPRGRPPVDAPPSGVRLVRVEERDAAWAGVAARDSGEDSTATLKRLLTLFAGDVAALLLFAAIGRSNHGETALPLEIISTAAPFILGWLLTAPVLGGFGAASRGREPGAAAAAAARAWAGAAPAGLALRALSQGGRPPPLPFALVALFAGGALVIAWRTAAAATAPAPGARKSRQGNPLEFMQLLSGLVKRW